MSSDEEEIDSADEEEVSVSEEEEVVVKPKKKKGKKHKDPNKPKRNMSAFFLYSNAHRQRVKDENPGIKFGDVVSVWLYLLIDLTFFHFTCKYDHGRNNFLYDFGLAFVWDFFMMPSSITVILS